MGEEFDRRVVVYASVCEEEDDRVEYTENSGGVEKKKRMKTVAPRLGS